MTSPVGALDLVDWLVLVGRVLITFVGLLISVMIVVWIERKVIADMQTRIGPNRAGPFGILITLADGVKLFFGVSLTVGFGHDWHSFQKGSRPT